MKRKNIKQEVNLGLDDTAYKGYTDASKRLKGTKWTYRTYTCSFKQMAAACEKTRRILEGL